MTLGEAGTAGPPSRTTRSPRYTRSRELEIRVESPLAMPCGLALWGDFSLYQIAEAPGLLAGRILPRELLFLRYDLKAGENHLCIKLRGKQGA